MVLDESGGVLVWLLLVRDTEDDAELSHTDADCDCTTCSDLDTDLLDDVKLDTGTSLGVFPSGSSIAAK